jgi:serine/threonine-protein kinase RsbW
VPPANSDVRLPSGESFAWQVLSALTDEVSAEVVDGRVAIHLTKRRPDEYPSPVA